MSLLDDVLPHVTPTWRTAREISDGVACWAHTSVRQTLSKAANAGLVERRSVPRAGGEPGSTVWQYRVPR